MSTPSRRELGKLLELIVHDLRNPASTLVTNIDYARDALPAEGAADVADAISDSRMAVADVMRGLDQLAWIGAWLAGDRVASVEAGDALEALRAVNVPLHRARVVLELPDGPLRAIGAGRPLTKLVEILVAGAAWHARSGDVHVRASGTQTEVLIEVRDQGPAMAESLRPSAFTLEAQTLLKDRSDGRYIRAAGLFAANLAAEALGARLTASGSNGAALFRLTLPRA